jgi:hypothetical protein
MEQTVITYKNWFENRYCETGLASIYNVTISIHLQYEFNCLEIPLISMSTQLKNWFCNLGFWRWNHFYWPRDIPYLSKYRDYTVTLTKIVNGETRDPIENWLPFINTDYIYNPYKLVQCDTQDTNPTDGLSI